MSKPTAHAIVPSTTRTKPIQVSQNVTMSAASGPSELRPYRPTVKAITPNAPIGANRISCVQWKVDRPAGVESYSSPLVVLGPAGPELIVNSSTGVESFDPASGKSLWNYPEVNRFPIPVAMADGTTLFMSRGYRSSPFMAIKLGGRGDITASHVSWRVPTGAPYVSSLVLYEGLLYMGGENGIVSAVDAGNGQRVWQERIGGVFTASPIAGDGKVITGCLPSAASVTYWPPRLRDTEKTYSREPAARFSKKNILCVSASLWPVGASGEVTTRRPRVSTSAAGCRGRSSRRPDTRSRYAGCCGCLRAGWRPAR